MNGPPSSVTRFLNIKLGCNRGLRAVFTVRIPGRLPRGSHHGRSVCINRNTDKQLINCALKRYGLENLLDCLEANEKNGVVYHRQGIIGDYDDFEDIEKLVNFIRTGKR